MPTRSWAGWEIAGLRVTLFNHRERVCLAFFGLGVAIAGRWMHLRTEEFDRGFQLLAAIPKIGPQIALILEAREDCFYV